MRLNRKLIYPLMVAVAVGILAGSYWASVRISLSHLEAGVRDRDAATLEKYVDWPAVREQLRAEIRSAAMRHVWEDVIKKEGSTGGFLGAFLVGTVAPAMLDQFVDSFITPQSLVALLNRDVNGRAVNLTIREVGFTDFDEYTILFGAKEVDGDKMMKALLRRAGIIWRVVRVGFPLGEAPWEAVASPTPTPGLELGGVIPARTADGLIIEGDITNAGSTAREVPRLRVALRDAKEKETQFKVIDPPTARLGPGETAHFKTTFDNSEASTVKVSFASR
jgi:DUF2939 family protein